MTSKIHKESTDTACLAILGPTASGKSAIALKLAGELDGEIISCDSMQVYKGMDIGTAKPSVAEMSAVKHYLLNILDISRPFNASLFREYAEAAMKQIIQAGRRTIMAGGTGMYAKALIYKLELPPADRNLAAQLALTITTEDGVRSLIRELEANAESSVPVAILQNPRRTARAVEILRLTGTVPWVKSGSGKAVAEPCFRQFILLPELDFLKQRIGARCRQMFADGWIDEVRRLMVQGLEKAPTARQALGYREILRHLQTASPGTSRTDLIETVTSQTIQYARRQLTWFRNQHPGAEKLIIRNEHDLEVLPEQLLNRCRP